MKETMDRVTLYFRSDFGMGVHKIEARTCTLEVRPYAQYERGIHVDFMRARERRARGFTQASHPSLVILEGWGHPDPDGMFLPEQPTENPDVMTSTGRYSACDPRWQSDFDTKLAAYLEAKGSKILLHDFREHQPGCRGMMVTTCACFSCACELDAAS